MKVLFTTNFPAPYRVDFFNELGKYCDLTVIYERKKALHRDEKWSGKSSITYQVVELNLIPVGTSHTKGTEIAKYIKNNEYDFIVFGGYASESVMLAITYCRLAGKKYYIEYDGGFYKNDKFLKGIVKRFLIKGATGNFITCADTEKYLKSIGITSEKIKYYPFSSLHETELIEQILTKDEKRILKQKLEIKDEITIVSVGQFIHRKGIDVLLNALKYVDQKVEVYIIGGVPTKEYIELCTENKLENIHFISFCNKDILFEWYKASDLFVFPTREDIWGLVINEAMACGLPVISSNMCIAAKELVEENKNGLIFESENYLDLAQKINKILSENLDDYAANSLLKIQKHTIEGMVRSHMGVWESM